MATAIRGSELSRRRRVAVMAGMALLTAAAVWLATPALAAKTHTIAMDGTRFIPETITVKQGDRVVWVNKDPFPHTATAGGTFDSGSVAAGQSWSVCGAQARRVRLRLHATSGHERHGGRAMSALGTFIRGTWKSVLVSIVLGVSLAGCGGGGGGSDPVPTSQVPQLPLDPQLVAAGQQTFRFDTFGDETFWTDTLRMNKVIESAVDPLTAASVGLKIDAAALPADVVKGVTDGTIPLNDPQTTLALLNLNAVVGVKGQVSKRRRRQAATRSRRYHVRAVPFHRVQGRAGHSTRCCRCEDQPCGNCR